MFINLRNHIVIFFLALAWPISSAMASPDILFKNYSSDSGLPNKGICSFAQDRNGAVWVGTNEGICMFDGESFITPSFLQQEPFLSASGRGICIDSNNVLWLRARTGLLSYNLDTGETHFFDEYRALQILCDGDGLVWSKCPQGLVCYNPETGTWDTSYLENFNPVNISVTYDGELCATANDGCIYIKKPGQSKFTRIWVLSEEDQERGLSLGMITACDKEHLLYSTSDNSSHVLDLATGRTRKVFDGHSDGKDAILTGILARNSQQFWLTTDNGLFIYDDTEGSCTEYYNHYGNPYSLASSKLRCLFKDSQDRVWIGTFYDGISRLLEPGLDVSIFRVRPDNPEHSLSGRTVRSICAGEDGIVWAASEDGFLEKIFPDGRIVSFGNNQDKKSRSNTYQSIAYSDGKVYAVDLGDGLSVYDSESLKLLKKYNVGKNYCSWLLFTTKNKLLVGASTGLFQLDKTSDTFVRIDSVQEGFVPVLCEDWKGNVWVSVLGKGIYVYNLENNSSHLLEIEGDLDFSHIHVTDMYEDRDGRMLVTTDGDGLLIFQPDKNMPWKVNYTVLSRKNGLPSNICCAVTQDSTGKLWVSTMNGVVSIESDVVTDVTKYKTIGNCFSPGAILNAPDGTIYMGASDGVVAFNPLRIPERRHHLYLADIIKAQDDSFTSVYESGHTPFTSEKIRIHSYETSSLTFHLMCLKTDVNEVVEYRYSLNGNGRNIVSLSNESSITYANLTPGKYIFDAKVSRDDSPEACVSLLVQVLPPFYASLFAQIIYALLILASIFSILYSWHTRIRKDKERAIERLEAYKQKEVYESKINFFTNISHEIRTPLTMIKIPLDKIMKNKSYLPETEYDINCIYNSTDRLLDIIDQILDFRKMENGTAKLSFSPADLTKLIGDVCSRMEALAKECSVSLKTELPEGPVSIMCAPGSIDKIVSNLLMNGVKYCNSSVTVRLEVISGERVRVSVISDGAPVEPDEREKIFEPFYQSAKTHSKVPVNEGTGLGLSFARSLASLHNGTLTLDPSYMDGNSFVLELPAGQAMEKTEPEEESIIQGDEYDTNKHTILIVEDDTALNNYIKTELSSEYTVLQAYNGKQALSILKEKGVSLIVSDIMMPEMDGCELIDVVKNTFKFSHIPVILLTAVTDYNKQLESLHSGADGYITKPFSMQILRATIFNTLKNREILYDHFSSMPYTKPENISNSQDDKFMKNLYDYVMENISNQDFSVFDLACKMNISRSTLFRKIRAQTGMNINEYIRVCRLKKAAELLSTQKYQAKEVAYMVGFTSLSYFTKSFQKQFNMSPGSLLNKNQ